LGVQFGLVLKEVGRNDQEFRACFGSEEGDCKVRFVLWRYVEGLNGWVGVFVNRKYGTSRAALGVFVVEGWVVN
jgi:hypothetical protein